MPWRKAARVKDLAPGELTRFTVEGHEYLLARAADDAWYASDLSCTHQWAELDVGALVGTEIACVSHGAVFDLVDGRVVCAPATRPLRVFPVKVEGEEVLVDLPEHDKPPEPG